MRKVRDDFPRDRRRHHGACAVPVVVLGNTTNIFIESVNEAADTGGGAVGGGESIDKLMDSYKECDESITDDILSQLRCAYEKDNVGLYKGYKTCDLNDFSCHRSMGVFQDLWLTEIYDITVDEFNETVNIFGHSDFTGWFEFGQYLNSGDHYLASLSTRFHSFLLEFKNYQFRILSSWDGRHSFLDFPFNKDGTAHRWAYFNGHPDWNGFTRLMTTLNGGLLLNPDGSKITILPSDLSTWEWTDDELRESGKIYTQLFSVPINKGIQMIIDDRREREPGWKDFSPYNSYPKGKVIHELRVFIKINGLKEA